MENERGNLLKEWLKHKKAETKAKDKRIDVEKKLVEIYGVDFDGSSKSFKDGDFKTNIKKNVKISFDQDLWIEARKEISQELRPEKISFSVNTKGFDWLKENNKEIYKKVSDCIKIVENKPTVKVEKI